MPAAPEFLIFYLDSLCYVQQKLSESTYCNCKSINCSHSGHTCIYCIAKRTASCAKCQYCITLKLVVMCSFKNDYVLNKLQYAIFLIQARWNKQQNSFRVDSLHIFVQGSFVPGYNRSILKLLQAMNNFVAQNSGLSWV